MYIYDWLRYNGGKCYCETFPMSRIWGISLPVRFLWKLHVSYVIEKLDISTLWYCYDNTLRPRQNGRLFADDTFKRIFLNENIRILIKISQKFVPKGLISNIPALVLIMAWRRTGDKPLSEPMMVWSLTHICVTRPQWVNEEILVYDNVGKPHKLQNTVSIP